MIDIHTHILPGVDDGAKTVQISLDMLRAEMEQGIDTVVLTPHYYRNKEEPDSFLSRRDAAFERLKQEISAQPDRNSFPNLILGCEVAWVPNLADIEGIERLCIGQSKYMLLELPFFPWSDTLSRQLHDLVGRTGVTPILAHLERYRKVQTAERFEEILSLGLPVQIGADSVCNAFTRSKSLRALGSWAHIIAGDCHDLASRAPCMGKAMTIVKNKLGDEAKLTAVEAKFADVDISGSTLISTYSGTAEIKNNTSGACAWGYAFALTNNTSDSNIDDTKGTIKFSNQDMLYDKVKYLLDDPKIALRFGIDAYSTVMKVWNARIAAERLIMLSEKILTGYKYPDMFTDGPCSRTT